ncbi:hypothetical protein GUITHDRAFT_99130 [Guillardia theta CCMP2712]|uniref:tRNA-uridine aminocarboxypropyltransferase n=1 Tax=Guillardia theta (strain CCMP2712) TaxID=905079 RepID=L1K454_GUITC|nr:hypothetical protein GUITHDRAFT_99130 [Guillardia theta CCMP2712]EKX55347.1 hypothetical protein GUITHDRAFT_99130 [Guillardia theta CCMP2712]|mmetsp:Transcript_39476/g.124235  ORF Transcript_39476/g.124235 Transcript_39476/m.124235 type:complete len:323 (-) Transcript_39476:35-1003(-)|eukprot:XP_005842327.1 hypothetical protein GUITHDRAFT_99130 [Guillardia theta CCMP2712]
MVLRGACQASMAAILWTCSKAVGSEATARALRPEMVRRLSGLAGHACRDHALVGVRGMRGGTDHHRRDLDKSAENKTLLQSDHVERMMTVKRKKFNGPNNVLCKTCWLAMKDCICSHVRERFKWDRSFIHRIFFYMHSKEFGRCSNTACLAQVPFPFPQCDIFIAELPEDEERLRREISQAPESFLILYPSENSVTFSRLVRSSANDHGSLAAAMQKPRTVIVVDGTWRQTRRLIKKLPSDIPRIRLEQDVELDQLYNSPLRAQPSESRMCTLTSVALMVRELGGSEELFRGMLQLLHVKTETFLRTSSKEWKVKDKGEVDV